MPEREGGRVRRYVKVVERKGEDLDIVGREGGARLGFSRVAEAMGP